jgi:hypothetical protein
MLCVLVPKRCGRMPTSDEQYGVRAETVQVADPFLEASTYNELGQTEQSEKAVAASPGVQEAKTDDRGQQYIQQAVNQRSRPVQRTFVGWRQFAPAVASPSHAGEDQNCEGGTQQDVQRPHIGAPYPTGKPVDGVRTEPLCCDQQHGQPMKGDGRRIVYGRWRRVANYRHLVPNRSSKPIRPDVTPISHPAITRVLG